MVQQFSSYKGCRSSGRAGRRKLVKIPALFEVNIYPGSGRQRIVRLRHIYQIHMVFRSAGSAAYRLSVRMCYHAAEHCYAMAALRIAGEAGIGC